jgi:hypothetical protein
MPNTFGQPLYNYQSQIASSLPSFDQVYRADYNINAKWRLFVRALDSKQTQNVPYGRADTSNNLGLTPFYAPTYGWSITGNLATIVSATLTNEFQFGYTVNGIPGDGPTAGSPYYRSVSHINIPLLYPNADPAGVIPNFNFGGVPFGASTVNGSQMTSFAGTPYHNRNPVWNVIDNVTKAMGNHTIKAGFYYEYAVKTENAFRPYNSTIDFGRDPNNPGDTNWAFSNALLGNYATYSQINKDPLPNYPYTNIEWYGQDTWKVTKRLTVNYGLRMASGRSTTIPIRWRTSTTRSTIQPNAWSSISHLGAAQTFRRRTLLPANCCRRRISAPSFRELATSTTEWLCPARTARRSA